ncbi:MAG: hypothetical protein KDA42_09740, partial [Planctomycetales bacterium]|nr:hypothetical protein [Planctomycetales bacterium]
VFATQWNGADQSELFRKEDGNNRLLLSFQSQANIDHTIIPGAVDAPGISFGINDGAGYAELDVPFDGLAGRPTLAEVADGSPHHIIATYDVASGQKRIWLDGVLIGDQIRSPGVQMISGGGVNAFIGSSNGTGEPFDGVLDEVAIYDRALDDTSIAEHANLVAALAAFSPTYVDPILSTGWGTSTYPAPTAPPTPLNNTSFFTQTEGASAEWIAPRSGPTNVEVSWSAHDNRNTNARYDIYIDADLVPEFSVDVNQRLTADGTAVGGTITWSDWLSLGHFDMIAGVSRVVLAHDTATGTGNTIADTARFAESHDVADFVDDFSERQNPNLGWQFDRTSGGADPANPANWQGDVSEHLATGWRVGDANPFKIQFVRSADGTISSTTIAEELLNAATATGPVTISAGTYNITDVIDTEIDLINYDPGGSFGNDNPYPNDPNSTLGDQSRIILAADARFFVPAGTYTVAFGSDDGGFIRIPGVTFTSVFNHTGVGGAGTNEVRWETGRGHAWTGGTFTLAQDTLLDLATMFYENTGGDDFEVAVAPGMQPGFDINTYALLQDGVLGWSAADPNYQIGDPGEATWAATADQHTIISYTIQPGEPSGVPYVLRDSYLKKVNANGSVDVKLYVRDASAGTTRLIETFTVSNTNRISMDRALGVLDEGDMVFVAVQGNGNSDDSAVRLDFTLRQDLPEGVAGAINPVSVLVLNDDDSPNTEARLENVQISMMANEGAPVTLTGDIVDPNTRDTFTLMVDWGDGTFQTFDYPAGSTSFSETHIYTDEDPSGTSSDQYTVIVSIVDHSTAPTGGLAPVTNPGGIDAGLLYHLDAATGVIENGGAVSAWEDQSGAGNDFLQANADRQPLYVASGLGGNNLPLLRFDGANFPNGDNLVLTSPTGVQSVIIVNNTLSYAKGLSGIWGIDNADTGIRSNTAGQWVNPDNGGSFTNPAGSSIAVNGSVFTGNATQPAGTDAILSATRSTTLNLGTTGLGNYFRSNTSGGREWTGEIGEVLAFDRELSRAELQLLENYLSAKFGITIANDIYAGDNAAQGDYDYDVFGVNNALAVVGPPLQVQFEQATAANDQSGWDVFTSGAPPVNGTISSGAFAGVSFTATGTHTRSHTTAGYQAVNHTDGNLDNLLSGGVLSNDTNVNVTLTLNGLPDGDYTITTYHHTPYGPSNSVNFDVRLTDSNVTDSTVQSSVASSIGGTVTSADITKVVTSFTVSGGDSVTLTFDPLNAAGGDHLNLNGFELAAGAVGAGISYFPFSGDADSGISAEKTYTHAIDFGNQTGFPTATINGVVFANGSVGAFPGAAGTSQTVGTGTSTIPINHDGGQAAAIPFAGEQVNDLIGDMIYGAANGQITLTGLTPGQSYRLTLYNRQWGPSDRSQSIGFSTDGVPGAEHSGTFNPDNATQPDPGLGSANQPFALVYDYTLSPGVTTLTIDIDQLGAGTYHLYGLTNELTAGTGGDDLSSGNAGLHIEATGGTLNSGESVMAGHRTPVSDLTMADAPAMLRRWERVWFVDKTGDVDVRLTFDASEAGMAPTSGPFSLLYRAANSGSFVDTGLLASVSGDEVSFLVPNATLQDGYYTLGIGTSTTTLTTLIKNVDPQITNLAATPMINEDGTVTLVGQIVDPSPDDTFTVDVDWGDGTVETFTYPAGTTALAETHRYLDDTPTGTPQDTFVISATIRDDDFVAANAFDIRFVRTSGGVVSNTTEAEAVLAAATATGPLNVGGENFNVDDLGSSTANVVDYAGDAGDFGVNNPYPGTGPNDRIIIRADGRFLVPAGTYTLSLGSDDGGFIRIPGVTFSSVFNSVLPAGGDEVRFETNRGHDHTGGTFTLTEDTVLDFAAMFYENAGGDSFEVSIAAGTQADFNASFQLLGNGVLGWQSLNGGNTAQASTIVKNVAPSATDRALVTTSNFPGMTNVLRDITDVGTLDTHSVVPQSFATALGALVTIAADGMVTYDPNGRFDALPVGGTATDTFVFQIIDDDGGIGTGRVNVTINNPAFTLIQTGGLSPNGLTLEPNSDLAGQENVALASQGGMSFSQTHLAPIGARTFEHPRVIDGLYAQNNPVVQEPWIAGTTEKTFVGVKFVQGESIDKLAFQMQFDGRSEALLQFQYTTDDFTGVDLAEPAAPVDSLDWLPIGSVEITDATGGTRRLYSFPQLDGVTGVRALVISTNQEAAIAELEIYSVADQSFYDFELADYSVIEGDDVHTEQVVRVLRSGDLSKTTFVDVVLGPGAVDPATDNVDYSARSVPLVFAPGETEKIVPIEIFGDLLTEADETVRLSFGNFTGVETLSNGLMGLWEFEGGNANDLSGNGNNGTLFGPAAFGAGVVGEALSFDGVDDYIALDMELTGQNSLPTMSASAWFNSSKTLGGTMNDQWAFLDFDRSDWFNFYLRDDDGSIGFSTAAEGSAVHDMSSNRTSLNDGQWHHAVVTYDGVNKRIYIDGQLDSVVFDPHNGLGLGTVNPRFGIIGDGSEATAFNGARNNLYYEGLMDQVGMWGRALTGAEVAALYGGASGMDILSAVGTGAAGAVQPTSILTIVDDDTIEYDFTRPDFSDLEQDATHTSNVVLLNRTGRVDLASSVDVVITPVGADPATLNVDLDGATITLDFAPGETQKQVPLTIFGELIGEADETVELSLTNFRLGVVAQPRNVWTGDSAPASPLAGGEVWTDIISGRDYTVNATEPLLRLLPTAGTRHENLPSRAFSKTGDGSYLTGPGTMGLTGGAAFEIWFDSTLADAGENWSLFETGGATLGTSLTIGNAGLIGDDTAAGRFDDLRFTIKGSGGSLPDGTITVDLPNDWNSDFVQILGVYDPDAANGGAVVLYLNGREVGRTEGTGLINYDGTDGTAVFGEFNDVGGNNPAFDPDVQRAQGDVALLRLYDEAMSATDVLHTFSNVSGHLGQAGATQPTTVFTIVDDDAIDYTFDRPNYDVDELDATHTVNVVRVFRNGRTDMVSTVDLVLTSGAPNGATIGGDIQSGPVTLIFQPGETEKIVPLDIFGDYEIEPNEVVNLSFINSFIGTVADPNSIAGGAVLWLDGSDVDGDGTPGGAFVGGTTWVDKTTDASLANISQATAANQPTVVNGGANFNGLDVVQFDGANDSMGNAVTPFTARTVFVVFRAETGLQQGGDLAQLWGNYDGGFH